MSCRVGSSTNPEERIKYWKDKEGHTGSEILAEALTYDEAKVLEKHEAEKRGCEQEEGGPRVEGPVWSVYHVWGSR